MSDPTLDILPGPRDLEEFEIDVPPLPELPDPRQFPAPPRVLVVDDAPFMRALLKRILQAAGYQVDEAASGEEALAAIQQGLPDLITLDLNMPGMDGFGVMRSLRAQAPAARVVVVSAMGHQEHVDEARAAGALTYLHKPLVPADVVAAVERALGAPAPRPLARG